MFVQAIGSEDPVVAVETMTNAVMTFCARWQVKKAERLAVYTVQFAKYDGPYYMLNQVCCFCLQVIQMHGFLTTQFSNKCLQFLTNNA